MSVHQRLRVVTFLAKPTKHSLWSQSWQARVLGLIDPPALSVPDIVHYFFLSFIFATSTACCIMVGREFLRIVRMPQTGCCEHKER